MNKKRIVNHKVKEKGIISDVLEFLVWLIRGKNMNEQNKALDKPIEKDLVCPSCKSMIPANKKFCPNCGTKDHGAGLMRGWYWF